MPKISVIMAVYNPSEAELRRSIDSILGQSFPDFEFIIINDGSTDESVQKILDEYTALDSRISIITHKNMGLTKSLNIGLKAARGEYIARQDADDVSYALRLDKEIQIFDRDPEVVLVGGSCDDEYDDGTRGSWGMYASDELQKIVYMKTPFPHSTVMMRADVCHKLGGYDESYKTSQDMEFWMRFAKSGKLAMVEEPVLLRHITSGSISHKRRWRQFYDALRARLAHNSGFGKLKAVYYGFRSLIINLLPAGIIQALKGK